MVAKMRKGNKERQVTRPRIGAGSGSRRGLSAHGAAAEESVLRRARAVRRELFSSGGRVQEVAELNYTRDRLRDGNGRGGDETEADKIDGRENRCSNTVGVSGTGSTDLTGKGRPESTDSSRRSGVSNVSRLPVGKDLLEMARNERKDQYLEGIRESAEEGKSWSTRIGEEQKLKGLADDVGPGESDVQESVRQKKSSEMMKEAFEVAEAARRRASIASGARSIEPRPASFMSPSTGEVLFSERNRVHMVEEPRERGKRPKTSGVIRSPPVGKSRIQAAVIRPRTTSGNRRTSSVSFSGGQSTTQEKNSGRGDSSRPLTAASSRATTTLSGRSYRGSERPPSSTGEDMKANVGAYFSLPRRNPLHSVSLQSSMAASGRSEYVSGQAEVLLRSMDQSLRVYDRRSLVDMNRRILVAEEQMHRERAKNDPERKQACRRKDMALMKQQLFSRLENEGDEMTDGVKRVLQETSVAEQQAIIAEADQVEQAKTEAEQQRRDRALLQQVPRGRLVRENPAAVEIGDVWNTIEEELGVLDVGFYEATEAISEVCFEYGVILRGLWERSKVVFEPLRPLMDACTSWLMEERGAMVNIETAARAQLVIQEDETAKREAYFVDYINTLEHCLRMHDAEMGDMRREIQAYLARVNTNRSIYATGFRTAPAVLDLYSRPFLKKLWKNYMGKNGDETGTLAVRERQDATFNDEPRGGEDASQEAIQDEGTSKDLPSEDWGEVDEKPRECMMNEDDVLSLFSVDRIHNLIEEDEHLHGSSKALVSKIVSVVKRQFNVLLSLRNGNGNGSESESESESESGSVGTDVAVLVGKKSSNGGRGKARKVGKSGGKRGREA